MRLTEVRFTGHPPRLLAVTLVSLCGCFGYIGGPVGGSTPSTDAGVGEDASPSEGGAPGVDASTPGVDAGTPGMDGGPPPNDSGPPPSNPACSDGIDNDGDGTIDWQLDLGCWGPGDNTEGGISAGLDNGWSVFEASPDTRIVYVSSSSGDDSWSGLAPEYNGTDGPKKSVREGIRQMRDGSPDWLLFKRGDVWVDEPVGNWPISGRSEDEAAILGSYGESTQRPRFEVAGAWLFTNESGGASPNRRHVRIMGAHIVSYGRDPDDPRFNAVGGSCLQWLSGGGDVLIEDIKCEFAQVNLQGYPTMPFRLRRNVLAESYSLNSHAQAIFSSIAAPLIMEENIFYHGGWSERFRLALWNIETDPSVWSSVNNGRVRIVIDGQALDLERMDFSNVTSIAEVASVLQGAINTALGGDTVEILYSPQGRALQLRAPTLPTTADYEVLAYGGTTPGADLHQWLVGRDPWRPQTTQDAQGTPNSTIFNRNMYIANGQGLTVGRGNIDASGASGGAQFRMGGTYEDNLSLRNPHALVFGHAENPGNSTVGGLIRRNVVLGSANISTQVQGTGFQIVSVTRTRPDTGPSTVQDLEISDNILAHNVLGGANINAIVLNGSGPYRDVRISGNLVYDWALPSWPDEMDQRSFGLSVFVGSGSSNVRIDNNVIQQPVGGFAVASDTWVAGPIWSNNKYFSAAPNPPDIWSRGWYSLGSSVTTEDWVTATGETGMEEVRFNYVAPERDIETYMAALGKEATYESFTSEMVQQSRLTWRPEFTAAAVNAYVREGFRFMSPQ